jgi:hypothetical protein
MTRSPETRPAIDEQAIGQAQLHAELNRIIAATLDAGLQVRLIGSLAVRQHCPAHADLLDTLNRRPYHDLDFMAYGAQTRPVRELFSSLGYEIDPEILRSQEYGIQRLIFNLPGTELKVDVFLDDLIMAHRIPFRGRLGLDDPTVSLVDLLLSKLQIAKITDNDLKDLIVLIAEHQFGGADREQIDVRYLLSRMRRDWGFYTTASRNLQLVADYIPPLDGLPTDVGERVRERIHNLLAEMRRAPKTLAWRVRARVGTRIQWYEDVDEVRR